MRLHGPSPPQGKDVNSSLLFSLLTSHIQYSPPQNFGGEGEQTIDDEDFLLGAERSSVEFLLTADRNSVDFMVVS